MAHTQQPARTVRETVGDDVVTVRMYRSDPKYAGRVEIHADESWTFGVDAEGVARLLKTSTRTGLASDIDPPAWVLDLLAGFDGLYVDDVEGV